MSFTIDDIVRTLVAVLLRTDPWRHRFLCYRCLLALTLDSPVRPIRIARCAAPWRESFASLGPRVPALISLREVS